MTMNTSNATEQKKVEIEVVDVKTIPAGKGTLDFFTNLTISVR